MSRLTCVHLNNSHVHYSASFHWVGLRHCCLKLLFLQKPYFSNEFTFHLGNFFFQSGNPVFVRVHGNGRCLVDGHLDSILIVVSLAFGPGDKFEQIKFCFVQFGAKKFVILIGKRAKIFGFDSHHFFCCVIEQCDPLKFKQNNTCQTRFKIALSHFN